MPRSNAAKTAKTAKTATRTPGEPSDTTTSHEARDASELARGVEATATARARSAAERVSGAKTVEDQMAAMKDQLDSLAESNRVLAMANRALLARATPETMPTAPVRPTVDSMMEAHDNGDLDAPVLCKEGWLVPAVTPSNPIQQLAVAMRGENMSQSRDRTKAAVEKGKAQAVKEAEDDVKKESDNLKAAAKGVEQTARSTAAAA